MRHPLVLICKILSAAILTLTGQTFSPVAHAGDAAGPVIIGFDAQRGGPASFAEGSFFAEARNELQASYKNAQITGISTLSAAALAGANVVVLDGRFSNTVSITPLSASEQAALVGYVKGGGCAILLTDNDSYDPQNASASNTSLVSPFGIGAQGTLTGVVTVTISVPFAPLTDGIFGPVSQFVTDYPGALTFSNQRQATALRLPGSPLTTTVLAQTTIGPAMAIVPAETLQIGSGPVIVYSDANVFSSEPQFGQFSHNHALFFNTIDYCVNQTMKSAVRYYLPTVVRQ